MQRKSFARQCIVAIAFSMTIFQRGNGSVSVDEEPRRGESLNYHDHFTSDDVLQPYLYHHGPRHGNRHIRECQNVKYNNVTHSLQSSQGTESDSLPLPIVKTNILIRDVGDFLSRRTVYGHASVVHNPHQTVSVLEPLQEGTCQKGGADRATVLASADRRKCLVAVNAGFFNTQNGKCLGNIVSDGVLVQNFGGIQNAHFGVLQNGSLFVGYLSERFLLETDFVQLVGGVIWLVRNGENYINESIYLECEDIEETGTLQVFADVRSARTAVGYDKEGQVVIVQIDGKTHTNGLTLWEFSEMLIEMGVVNAVNLDGGGSATFVINGTVVNYPTDTCPEADSGYRCARKVSTILCVHEPDCSPSPNCTGHGDCVLGHCQCQGFWAGQSCNNLQCPQECSANGNCTEDGCKCNKGWKGESCNRTCEPGWYGWQCSEMCRCTHGASCDPVDGACDCPSGYAGLLCDRSCSYGHYGKDCQGVCYCPDHCACDPFTGSCDYSLSGTTLNTAATCLMDKRIKQKHLVVDQPEQYRLYLVSIIVVSVVAAASIVLNISLVCAQYVCNRRQHGYKYRKPRHTNVYAMRSSDESANEGDREDSSNDEEAEVETSFITRLPKR